MPPKKEKVVFTDDQINDEITKANLRLAAIKAAFIKRREEVASSRAEEEELREKCQQLDDAFREVTRERFDIVSDFMRQCKATEDELIARITLLDSTITDLTDQKELSKLALEETRKERDQLIEMKQREYDEQAKKMEEMREEFRIMLEDTRGKMRDRVEATVRVADAEEDIEADEPMQTDA